MTTAPARVHPSVTGAPLDRLDGRAKVTGTATYAFEHPLENPAYLFAVVSTIAKGRITAFDASTAEKVAGVLTVLSHENAPRLASHDDRELDVCQSDAVGFHGQLIGAVVAETPEAARHAAGLVRVEYEEKRANLELRAGGDDLYAPDVVNPSFPTDTNRGDVDAAMASAAVTVDRTYTTPTEHHNPMEPHTTVALWDGDGEGLTLYDSTQGVYWVRDKVAPLFGLDPARVRVVSPHVGGGFGSKGLPHSHLVLAALAARAVRRPVKFAVTRQQLFALAGYRTPTVQHVRLAADAQGRLAAISNDVVEQTSAIKEFAEQTAVPTRGMYAAPSRRTSHRLAALDVPVPTWMRAPGECPGMFAPEVAMDELAYVCGLDPIEVRVRNEPDVDPESGLPFSSRNLVACLREGADRFGWAERDPTPGVRRHGRWLRGTGVAASTYPTVRMPGSRATIHANPDGRYTVSIAAADIGTGTWTALTQIAADALGAPVEDVELRIGDTAYPAASGAGGSSGINSWGTPIVEAARRLRTRIDDEHGGSVPVEGVEASAEAGPATDRKRFAMRAFGAQFAEVRVDADSGEVRAPRLLGIFAVGRVINAKTARSQLLGGMTMGLSMALHEQTYLDERYGHFANHDFAEYHIAVNADVGSVEVDWIDEDDPYVNPMGSKGIGELGIVGTAAAIANAAYHATARRLRDLPLTPDRFF